MGNLRRVRTYVDEFVAHKQVVPVADVPTFKDIDDAIDELGELVRKYMVLVQDVDQMLDAVVAGDVMAPFRMPWLLPLSERPRPWQP